MPFDNGKTGFQNEDDFTSLINNKLYDELDFSIQLFIEDLFENIDKNVVFECEKNRLLQKCDFFIKNGNQIKRVSLKKGIKNSVHTEPITELIHFLIENKMPRDLVFEFLKYHYADGTTNGKGLKRLSSKEYQIINQDKIDKINLFLSQEHIIRKSIQRFIIKGRNSFVEVDAILYGVPTDFIWIKKEDIYNILLKKRNVYSKSIHFSNLTYQPLDRCLNHNPKYERCRYISQIKWYNLFDDIIENKYDKMINDKKYDTFQADYVE